MSESLETRAASSFHRISGDEPLSLFRKGLYTLSFLREKVTESASNEGFPVLSWTPRLDAERLKAVFGQRLAQFSSNRVLCSDFLLEAGKHFLGERPRIVDLGCGPGEYSEWLRSLFNYEQYLGIDIVSFEQWREYVKPNVQFRAAAVGTAPIDVSDATCLFSISALEHVRFDKQILLDLRARTPLHLKHLHLIPGVPSFFQYKAHGYRRYNLSFVRQLVDVPGVSDVQVFALGNVVTRGIRRGGVHSAFDQMLARRSELVPRDAREAPFLALCFTQHVVTTP